MSSVREMILQWGSTIKVSIELPVATRHCRDMTEKLLKATLNPNSHRHSTPPYLTLPSSFPYPVPTISLSQLLTTPLYPIPYPVPYPTLHYCPPNPTHTLAYPSLPYPPLHVCDRTSRAEKHWRRNVKGRNCLVQKCLGPKHLNAETSWWRTSRAEASWCRNVKGRNILVPKSLGAEMVWCRNILLPNLLPIMALSYRRGTDAETPN